MAYEFFPETIAFTRTKQRQRLESMKQTFGSSQTPTGSKTMERIRKRFL
ncbi:hypothetical protein MPNT_230036 [Candidatus Methylacidithermus pantelleriae]|uniref:Uncharacterized protein n=1 Tax=Candidatus Methylacidithermus pantelleriae TaxID=2744239 RepID=A0A8J2FSP5_9BACT|nr:hypothetical protein MPNT_230036 [Candidatus Methylacidithermus pantelleriae]